MLSSTPSRAPGEDFRRKVASHWGVTYAQLEALALGEEPPSSTSKASLGRCDTMPPNFTAAVAEYAWTHELPHELRVVVREQARMHYAYARLDLPREEWQRIITGLEREALALVARASLTLMAEPTARPAPRAPRKRRPRT